VTGLFHDCGIVRAVLRGLRDEPSAQRMPRKLAVAVQPSTHSPGEGIARRWSRSIGVRDMPRRDLTAVPTAVNRIKPPATVELGGVFAVLARSIRLEAAPDRSRGSRAVGSAHRRVDEPVRPCDLPKAPCRSCRGSNTHSVGGETEK